MSFQSINHVHLKITIVSPTPYVFSLKEALHDQGDNLKRDIVIGRIHSFSTIVIYIVLDHFSRWTQNTIVTPVSYMF